MRTNLMRTVVALVLAVAGSVMAVAGTAAVAEAAITNPQSPIVQYADKAWNWDWYDPNSHGTVNALNWQPDFACAEFVARALSAGGLLPGLNPNSPRTGPQSFADYTPPNSTKDYHLWNVGTDTILGLYDYLIDSGLGKDVGDSPASARPGDVVFYYTDAARTAASREHATILIQTGTTQDGSDTLIDGHNVAEYHDIYRQADSHVKIVHLRTLTHMATGSQTTDNTPSMAAFDGKLFVCWTGTDGRLNLAATTDGMTFGTRTTLPDQATSGCTLAGFNGELYLAYLDPAGTVTVQGLAADLSTDCRHSTGATSTAFPALAVNGTRLYLAWNNDDVSPGHGHVMMDFSTSDCQGFDSNTYMLPDATSASPALNGWNNAIWVAWTGLNASASINVAHWTNGDWTGANSSYVKQTLDESTVSSPALTKLPTGALVVGWAGTDPQHHLNTMTTTTGTFSTNATTYNDSSTAGPGLASFQGRLDVSWRGTDTPSHLNVGYAT